jgi:hypothetical protein
MMIRSNPDSNSMSMDEKVAAACRDSGHEVATKRENQLHGNAKKTQAIIQLAKQFLLDFDG